MAGTLNGWEPGPQLVLLAGLAAVVLVRPCNAIAQERQPAPFDKSQQCEAIKDEAGRRHCLEGLTARPDRTNSLSINIGTWRLVHTPNPQGGADAVSIMQTADVTKSDLDLAGLMLRCGEGNIETVLVLARPFPPRAHPTVTVVAGGQSETFTTAVAPPGAVLLLPPQVTLLAAGSWQSAAELAVQVEDERPIQGVISLKGLGMAYRMLVTNCPLR